MKDVTKKSDGDLHKEIKDTRKELQKFRFGSAGSRTRNVKEGALLKKKVARLITELNRRKHIV